MSARKKHGYQLTQEHYAYIYGVHPNTIHRWQKRRLPLDNPQGVMRYLAVRPSCPAAVKSKGAAAIMADFKMLGGG